MKWVKLGIVMNILNLSDLITTLYAIYFLGFREANVAVVKMLEYSPILYIVVKLAFPILLLLLYIVCSSSDRPIAVGISKGCEISFLIMTAILGTATFLNIWQIAFKADATQILSVIAKLIPTLRIG